MPYVSQWESAGLVQAILEGHLDARDDPRWADSGASDPDQYAFWSWRCCGMACLRSVLLARFGEAPGTVTLGLEVLQAGGYRLRHPPQTIEAQAGGERAGGERVGGERVGGERVGGERVGGEPEGLDGLIYAPFARYLADRWGIRAEVVAALPTSELVGRVRSGQWVVASVDPGIRRPERPPPSRGGHLVLVHGVAGGEDEVPVLVLHNPSGDTAATQADVRLPVAAFDRFFAYRGVVIHPD